MYKENETFKEINELFGCQKDLFTSQFGRNLLGQHGYHAQPLYFFGRTLMKNGDFVEGVDDLFFIKDIPYLDILGLNEMDVDVDNGYYTIDYRMNNFNISDEDSDEVIYVNLSQETLFYKGGKGHEIDGILSLDNPDYLMYIRYIFSQRGDKQLHSLINAYLLSSKSLRNQIITNLNQIRTDNNEPTSDFNTVPSHAISELDRTLELYEGNPKAYNFEIIKATDPTSGKSNVMMKLKESDLETYLKFDEGRNGEFWDL